MAVRSVDCHHRGFGDADRIFFRFEGLSKGQSGRFPGREPRSEGIRVSSDSVEERCRFWRALGQGGDKGYPDSRTLSAGGLQGFHFFSVCRRARLCRSHRIIRIVLPAVHADRPKWADGPRSSRYVYLYGNSECVVVSPGGERRNGGGTDAGNWYSAAADELRRGGRLWWFCLLWGVDAHAGAGRV